MLCGIYEIKHHDSQKRYIGSSLDFEYRLRKHKERLRASKHANPFLQNAFDKYGEDRFEFSPILVCEKQDLLFYEQLIMDSYKSYKRDFGYNIRVKAESNSGLDSKKRKYKVGNKYGRLILKCIEIKRINKPSMCRFLCDCGEETVANISAVVSGSIVSCGCAKVDMLRERRKAFAGSKYNRLTLLEQKHVDSKTFLTMWLCRCDCGKEVILPISRIKRGLVKSCGCYKAEVLANIRKSGQ